MEILGIRVDEVDKAASLDLIRTRLSLPRPSRGFAQVVTLNPEGIMLAREDAALKNIIAQAALVTPDGSGLLWAANQLGRPLKERVTGIDLLEDIAGLAGRAGWRVYFLGAKPGYAQLAAEALKSRYPGLIVAGVENGYFREREATVLAAIQAAEADILFAALGMPYQEHWLYEHQGELQGLVALGVGGSFDVLAGKVKRAPRLWQKLCLEWLWRLLSDPRRWRRYLALPRFMAAVGRAARQNKNKKK